LALSELEEKDIELQKKEVDLNVLIENIITIFRDTVAGKGVGMELTVGAEETHVRGDPFKLEQMFVNLIDNAVKYTESGEISMDIMKENGELVVKIRDTGIGIPGEQLSRIFERFYVVDKSRSKSVGGTGLGLSIVKHIAQLHDADISVESSEGEGSTFTIRFRT
jgi:two-component system phosphate regulon sensor histidine kinase PhoR